jgi:hypothetical protein
MSVAPGQSLLHDRLVGKTGEVAITVLPPAFAAVAITPDGKYWTLSTSRLLTDLYVVIGLR